MKETTDTAFDQDVATAETVLVDFWAPWCGPCKVLSPVLEKIAGDIKDPKKIAFLKVNTDDNPKLSTKYEISAVPTVLIFKNGKLDQELVGLNPEKKYRTILGL